MNLDAGRQKGKRTAQRGGSGPTVADVARVAGVSPMTVSRVVNGEVRVASETRARVKQVIAQLNYVPNLAARSLAGRGQCRLALLHDNPSAAFMSELLMGCLEQVRTSDAQLLIEPYDPAEGVEILCGRLRQHRTDGVLLPALLCDKLDFVDALQNAGFAVARIAATQACAAVPSVGIDDEAASYAMTRHLIGLGHRRIGYIAGPSSQYVSSLRLSGHTRALATVGLEPDPACLSRGDFTYRSGLAAAEALLDAPERPTAIIASNDDMAAAAIAVAHRRHLDVPGDLSVCGFDDSAMARTVWPEITTIRQPVAAMAEQATTLLVEQVEATRRGMPVPARQVPLDFELVVRGSDGPPTARPCHAIADDSTHKSGSMGE